MSPEEDRTATLALAPESERDPSLFHGAPAPGTVLAGKYRIDEILGSGGMAVVAAAYHLQLRRRVAIKFLVRDALEFPDIVERFSREARAAARIRGEHVARVIDIGVFDDGAPYIVLEYLEGEDLAEHLRKLGPLPTADVVRYMLQVCEVLAEAHTAKVIHRDLKPANLFLAKGHDHRRLIKVLDFGVSKIVDEPMTSDGSKLLGTIVYMSPEQLESSRAVDSRTDIWSLGVIMYELLTGATPFTGATVITIAHKIKSTTPELVNGSRPEIPKALAAIIHRCLAKSPADRHASVLDLARELAPFADPADRKSIDTITGVVCGSLAPPANTSDPPARTTPVPLESDAPITTPVPAEAPPASRSFVVPQWARSKRTWVAAAAMAIAAVVSSQNIASSPPATNKKPPPTAPLDITVHVSSTVPNARASIDDGPPVSLPVERSVPRDDHEHVIKVEADGYVARAKTVHFTSDVYLSLSLEASTPAASSATP
jgi:serine/threonine-protein kinase